MMLVWVKFNIQGESERVYRKACICFLLQYAGLSHRGHSLEGEEEVVQSL